MILSSRAGRGWLALLMLTLSLTVSPGHAEPDDGFLPLFPEGDLSGWVPMGRPSFTFAGDELNCAGDGDYPDWLRSREVFENFVLCFEFQIGKYGEGGVFIHAPLHGRNSRVGFEIQLSDDTRVPRPLTNSTGAIFGVVPPTKDATRPLGEWNAVEITMDWPRLAVAVNGTVVQDLNVEQNPELAQRLRSGFLGFQDRGKPYRIRGARIKRLPSTEKPWQSLFNGRDFSGWTKLDHGARFRVVDGVILAEDGNGYLLTEGKYSDFELKAYVRTSWLANGGIFFRWNELSDRGYEIQIEDIPDSRNPTGSIYDRAPALDIGLTPGEWYLMQVFVQGTKGIVRVNGITVAQADDLVVRPGRIALQMHRRDSWIRFKDIQIKPLD